ncbi:DUF7706 family protein [Noviherbaspirillum autotrophicum]|uniref:Uncharacterized protein n=1 Tax=Noviherbaspirillum autotrophicum TaxID=709839 RepID=A0A0C2BSK6_9BURK|nr:hypothetical protein [Noviherbaspirillum autotrophicum]KIF83044.1 hypothetical protein TSA66_22950 [Noviherbaspirillum autotrophicum]
MNETTRTVRFEVQLTEDEAREYALFLKKATFADYRELATSEQNAYLMIMAGERIREELRKAGYAPR